MRFNGNEHDIKAAKHWLLQHTPDKDAPLDRIAIVRVGRQYYSLHVDNWPIFRDLLASLEVEEVGTPPGGPAQNI